VLIRRNRSCSSSTTRHTGGWPPPLAACILLGLNDLAIKATPEQALALLRSAANGELDETAITTQLRAFSGTSPARHPVPRPARSCREGELAACMLMR
jgi:hypothetical protein